LSEFIHGSLDNLAVDPGAWNVKYTVAGTKNVVVRALFENVQFSIEGNSFQDRMPIPYRARVYEIVPR